VLAGAVARVEIGADGTPTPCDISRLGDIPGDVTPDVGRKAKATFDCDACLDDSFGELIGEVTGVANPAYDDDNLDTGPDIGLCVPFINRLVCNAVCAVGPAGGGFATALALQLSATTFNSFSRALILKAMLSR
jgi:hypothetical protein